ncbi:MAG: hypothetical protein IJC09_06605 [Clostridia bacterium]|nr:hypothetical protein [Clostridia bacterium]
MGRKRRWGDRKDAVKLRKLDSMHYIMPLVFPKRCESEVFIHERIDLTNLNKYIREKNAEKPELRYSLFHIIIAAILKTIVLRPNLNRFVSAPNIYQRNDLSAAFIVKTSLSDEAEEAMAFVNAEETDTLDTIRKKIYKEIDACRDELQKDSSQQTMDFIAVLPGWVRSLIGVIVRALDHRGLMPKFMIANDPHYASVMLSQLGSIKLGAAYHHLTDWGTNSLFLTVGEKKMRPFYDALGNVTMKSSIEIGFTVDERISDGFYFAKSIRLMKKLLEHPELLEVPFNEKVLY